MTLNSAIYRHYYQSRHGHIERLNRFISALHLNNLCVEEMECFTRNILKNLSSEVLMDEVFHLRWNHILQRICVHPVPMIHHILMAMDIRQIAMPQLLQMDVINAIDVDPGMTNKLKLLILCSRALAPIASIPESQRVIRSLSVLIFGDTARDRPFFADYPWTNTEAANVFNTRYPTVSFFLFLSFIYEHLIEHFHEEFGIHALDALYKYDDGAKQEKSKQRLLRLVEAFGFIPWHRACLGSTRRALIASCNVSEESKFLELVLEANFISRYVLKPFITTKEASVFMSDFILYLIWHGLVELKVGTASVEQSAIMQCGRQILEAVTIANRDRQFVFESLCELLASSVCFSADYVHEKVSMLMGAPQPIPQCHREMVRSLLLRRMDWIIPDALRSQLVALSILESKNRTDWFDKVYGKNKGIRSKRNSNDLGTKRNRRWKLYLKGIL